MIEIAIIIILLGTCIVLLRVLLQEKKRIRFMKDEHRKEMVDYSDKIAQRTKDIYTLIDNEKWNDVQEVKTRYNFYREMEEFMWFGGCDPYDEKNRSMGGFVWTEDKSIIPKRNEEEVVGDGFAEQILSKEFTEVHKSTMTLEHLQETLSDLSRFDEKGRDRLLNFKSRFNSPGLINPYDMTVKTKQSNFFNTDDVWPI